MLHYAKSLSNTMADKHSSILHLATFTLHYYAIMISWLILNNKQPHNSITTLICCLFVEYPFINFAYVFVRENFPTWKGKVLNIE